MSGQVKLSHYDGRVVLVDGEVITEDYNTAAVDIRRYLRGVLKVTWSGYDGSNGNIIVQHSSEHDAPDAEWSKYKDSDGSMTSAAGSCQFHIWRNVPIFFRVRIELGDGTTATVTSKYIFGSG